MSGGLPFAFVDRPDILLRARGNQARERAGQIRSRKAPLRHRRAAALIERRRAKLRTCGLRVVFSASAERGGVAESARPPLPRPRPPLLRRSLLEPTSSSRRKRSQSQTRSDTSGGRQPTAEVSAPRINERKHSRRDPMSEPSAPRRRCRLEGGLEDEDKRRADGRETNRRAHPYNAGEHEYKQESASSAHTPPSRTALPFAANCGRRASNSSSQPRSFPRCVELFLPLP